MRMRWAYVCVAALGVAAACGDDDDGGGKPPRKDAGSDASGGTSTGGGTGGVSEAATGGTAGVAGSAGALTDAAPDAELDASEDVSLDAESDADATTLDSEVDAPEDVAPETTIDASLASWGFAFGNPAQQDQPGPVAFDAAGNAFVVGTVFGPVSIGGTAYPPLGSNDTMLIKLDATGTPLWVHRGGGSGDDRVHGVGVDGSGNVYITGVFSGTATFAGGSLVSAGSWDIFVAKYAPNGTHLWSKRYGGPDQDQPNALGVDAASNVYIAGDFWGSMSLGGATLTPVGGVDVFAAKLDSSGNHVWSVDMGGASEDSARAIATTPGGESYVFGTFEDTADFGDGPHVANGGDDVYLVKLSALGVTEWSFDWGANNNYEAAIGLAADPSGNVTMVGFFAGQMAFGPTPLSSVSGNDCYVAKLNSAGGHVFSHAMGGPGLQRCTSVATTVGGDVIIGADYDGDMTVVDTVHTAKPGSFLVAKLGPTGLRKWSMDYAEGQPWFAALAPSGASLITGRFSTSLTMGSVSVAAGASDIFVVQLPP